QKEKQSRTASLFQFATR
ncbi:Glycogen synthase, partial [Haemophilus influenzae]